MNEKVFLLIPLTLLIGGLLFCIYQFIPGKTKKFKVGDRVRIKSMWSLVSERHPKPDVWVIEDVYRGIGYKIFKEGTCITTLKNFYDRDLEPAPDAPRNEIDVFINDTLRVKNA